MKQSQFIFSKPVIENLNYKINNINDEIVKPNNPISVKTTINVKKNDIENNSIVELNFYVQNTDNFPFHIDITMSSLVSWDEQVTNKNIIDNILNHNVPAMILSYMRPIISSITSHSKYGSFDIPFLDLRENNDNKE